MRLLLTRPIEDATALAALLKQLGHVALVAPLMEVQFHDGPPLDLEGVQGVLATSANGVRALALRTAERNLPIYAVGPQTAEAARSLGFQYVRGAEGDAAALVEAVAGWAEPGKGALLHAAGAETAGRMRQALEARGFALNVVILYEALPVARLPDNAAGALREGTLDGVLLFSPRSAKIFAALVTGAGLAQTCARLAGFCISPATATALGSLALARVAIAGAPNQEAMLALLSAPK
jgi:uroporphyrinogen-III synthase